MLSGLYGTFRLSTLLYTGCSGSGSAAEGVVGNGRTVVFCMVYLLFPGSLYSCCTGIGVCMSL